MYENYEEQVIDGIMHYRCTPDGEWIKMSAEELTKRILILKADISRLMSPIWP